PVVFLPLFRKILKLSRERRTAASLVTCLLILLLFVLPVSWLAVAITQQSIGLYQDIQASMEGEAAARLQEFQRRPWVQWGLAQTSKWLGTRSLDLRQATEQSLTAISRFLVGQTPSFLRGVGQVLFGFLLVFIVMFFLFRDGRLLLKLIEASNPLPTAYES